MTTRQFVAVAAWASLGVLPVFAQTVISARAGLIHYVEGRVILNDKAVETKFASFPEVMENQVLRTEQGRAEVLLGPGVFLRMGENSSFRMITNRLIDTRVEHLTGAMLIECVDVPKGSAVTVADGNTTISLLKKGLYRFDGHPAQVRVYEGQAWVESGGQRIELTKGKWVSLDGNLVAGKFDPKLTDELFRWSERRAEYIAMANVSAARSLRGNALTSSGWSWNPYFGMFTFMPMSGSYYSPFGYRYWSPGRIYTRPSSYDWSNSGYSAASSGGFSHDYPSVSSTSSGSSGTIVSAGAPTSSSQGSSAPISRGSGSAGGSHR